MGNKPIFKAKVTIPRGEEGFWEIILELDEAGPFTIGDIEGRSNVAGGTVSGFCRKLRKGGYIVVAGERAHPRTWFGPSTLYRVAKRVELTPRLNEDGSDRPEPQIETIWRTIKMLRTFNSREVAREIAPADPDKKLNTVRDYLGRLAQVGIIARVDGGQRSRHGGGQLEARYQLVNNLGARAPKLLATKLVFDPNAGAIVGTADVKETGR